MIFVFFNFFENHKNQKNFYQISINSEKILNKSDFKIHLKTHKVTQDNKNILQISIKNPNYSQIYIKTR